MKKASAVLLLAGMLAPQARAELNQMYEAVFTQMPLYDAFAFIANDIADKGMQLYTAALHGDLDAVHELVELGIYVDYVPEELPTPRTPLMAAIIGGHELVVAYLIHSGADVNQITRDKYTAMDLALAGGNARIIALLREQGAVASGIDGKHVSQN